MGMMYSSYGGGRMGGGGQGSLAYVGSGQGDYIQETTYKYVGCGGDFARPRPDPTSSLVAVRDSDFTAIRLRIGLRTVGDDLVSSPTGVLLLNNGKGLHHGSP